MPKKKKPDNLMIKIAESYLKSYEDRYKRPLLIGGRPCSPQNVTVAWKILVDTGHYSHYGEDGWNPRQEDKFAEAFGRENVSQAEVIAEGLRDFMLHLAGEV